MLSFICVLITVINISAQLVLACSMNKLVSLAVKEWGK
uniref:Uncharacterized protein n=1 Tax=Arundo donax TaxID=35708 RepID=A0A0A9FX27_ARUDO